ncbi:MAG TPA: WhiB family transcriptional regulator [Ilumatobacter sp.]|nr:WhiB family transcriptional regulator [Ilumatobacter sp.]
MITLPRRPQWHDDAACRDVPTEVMFPREHARYADAVAICQPCPVRQTCLESNLHEAYGVWGGTTARERRELRMGRRSLSSATPPHPAASRFPHTPAAVAS